MRQARKSAMQEDYADAIRCYQQILQVDTVKENMDLQLRLAWCFEQNEQWQEARRAYARLFDQYEKRGEWEAARLLKPKLQQLQDLQKLPVEVAKHVETLSFPELLRVLKDMGSEFELDAGDVLCDAGDTSHVLWLLEEGILGVKMPDYPNDEPDDLCARDGVSVLVGELGLFTHQRRSARVWARNRCRLYAVPVQHIEALEDTAFQSGMYDLLKTYWIDPILSKHAIFERVNDVDRRYLSTFLKPLDMKPGATLVKPGEDHDGAYLLQRGCLFFVHEKVDTEQVTSIYPGDLVHLSGLLHGYRGSYEIRVATEARLLYLSREDFDLFAMRRPWIIQALLHYSRRPAWLQVTHPDDAYLWMTDRQIRQRHVSLKGDENGG